MDGLYYYIMVGVIFLLSTLVSARLKSKFSYYSKVHLNNGLSGKEIAERMLRDNGISDVKIISTPGQLTDHYNPLNKTINLSESVYNERNAAAAAVAAHETGHAIQHAVGYSMLHLRSGLVPVLNISSKFTNIALMVGLGIYFSSGNNTILWIGIFLFSLSTLFSFVTLPVEFDASNRALKWLKERNIVTPDEYDGAADSLKWAAGTYVVAALGSMAQLIYFIMQANRRSD